MASVIKDQPVLICPHCNEFIIISQLNCGIFRHGVFKNTGIQVNPHASKAECDDYANHGLIYGCGKPFRITLNNNTFEITCCEYI
jgi:hypothetical protein